MCFTADSGHLAKRELLLFQLHLYITHGDKLITYLNEKVVLMCQESSGSKQVSIFTRGQGKDIDICIGTSGLRTHRGTQPSALPPQPHSCFKRRLMSPSSRIFSSPLCLGLRDTTQLSPRRSTAKNQPASARETLSSHMHIPCKFVSDGCQQKG